MSTHKLIVFPENRVLSAPNGASVADVLREFRIPIGFPCCQRGLCGKCLIEIVEGEAGSADDSERAVLDRQHRPRDYRLACRVDMRGPLSIRIAPEARLATIRPLAEGRRRMIAVDPPLKKFVLVVPGVSLADPESALDGFLAKFAFPRPTVSLSVLPILAGLDPRRGETVTAVLYKNRRILAVEPGDTSGRSYGAAVDLGTTTVVVEVVDLNDGRTAAVSAGLNGQARFGADVVSRITAAHLDPGQRFSLRDEARHTINGLLAQAACKAGVRPEDLYEVVVAGNTAMSHLFLGLPVSTLAAAPFQALFSSLEPLDAPVGGLDMNAAGQIYLAPNIKSFVGGDIAAGLMAVDIENGPERALFIDLGTNGEIVLKNGQRLLATSTAAGPAFEGMGLSCGMMASPGAVYKAEFKDGEIELRVLGAGKAEGVCGSGLIDILAVALARGWMDSDGQILSADKFLRLSPDLILIQKDIREIQLAAAAVRTGMRMLLDEAGLSVGQLERIYVAGAFGSTLDIGNAMRIGLIPTVDPAKIEFVGNASLAGAKILLLSAKERERCEQLARSIRHVSLALGETFQDIFIDSLAFRSWPL
jgi:uncharacterized 2Fe-2S/4Fe-4S cluster protein (DUF4445 family)